MNRESMQAIPDLRAGPPSLAARIEDLIRSLAGVHQTRADVHAGVLRSVFVVPAPAAAPRGIIRNVQSALMAAHGIALDPRAILLVPELPQLEYSQPVPPVPAPTVRVPAVPAADATWSSARSATPLTTPNAPVTSTVRTRRIELLELNRYSQDQLQCRVVIEEAGLRRSGQAEAGEEREGAITLAARATLAALRAMEPGDWLFEGAADVIIGGQRHVCVSVKKTANGASLSGAAPVLESVEHAIASAVLNAASLTTTLRDPARQLVRGT